MTTCQPQWVVAMNEADLIRQAQQAQRDGQLPRAIALLQQLLAHQPQNAAVLNNLGGLQDELGQTDQAITCFRRAAAAAPDQAAPQFNLGESLRKAGEHADAITALRAAATLEPNLADAWAALGAALLADNRPTAALGALRRALDLRPTNDGACRLLGDALQSLRRFDESAWSYEQALGHNPRNSDAWYGLGRLHLETGRPVEAIDAFERCVALDGSHWAAVHDQGKALFQLGCVEKAMPWLRRAAEAGSEEVRARALENLAIIVPGSPADDNRSVGDVRRCWHQSLPRRAAAERAARRHPGPVRVGYVSAFFQHANWMKPVWALINHHDRDRFEVHLFSDAAADQLQGGYRHHAADRVHDISGQSNEAVASAIGTAGIDILIDLNGFSAPRRLALFALRPAPVSVGWFNLYGTSGLDGLDYLIGDEHVIPVEEESYYLERVVRVPHSYLTFEVDYPVPAVAEPPVLATGQVTIGCLASQYKITDVVIATWAEILRRCPAARLLIRNATLGPADHQHHLRERWAAQGLPQDRLTLEGPGEHFAFLQTYDRIDFALDPFPYSGGTTTMEALWQGVPVVTFNGDRWASRTSVSLLKAAGLDEFVGRDRQEYVDISTHLATAPDTVERLRAFRAGIRERLRRSAVCDVVAFARSMEALYERMVQEWTTR